jgi:peptide/nickel transport system substrate-binding protein
MQVRPVVTAITAVAVAGLVLTSCSGKSAASGSKSSVPNPTLRMLSVEPSQGFDPNGAFADASRIPMAMIYETLTERDGAGKIVGSLAEKWDVSPDAKTYTFTLRPNVKFSDGSPITAEDVKFSFERMETGLVMKAQLEALQSIEITGDSTIKFTLKHPMSTFTALVGRPANAAILSKKAVSADSNYFTKPTVTSGPWTLSQYTPKSQMTFSANPNYYNEPKIKKVIVSFNNDPTASAAALESGSADVAGLAYSDGARLRKEGRITVVQADQLAPLFWGWDRTKAPFDNKLVRQAVAWAVDRPGKQEACWYGTGGVTYGNILRPWDPSYVELNTYKADTREAALSKAKALLDQAGWKAGSDGVRRASGVTGVADGKTLSFEVPYEGNWPAAECHVQILQQNLKQVGIEVKPRKYDPAAYWGDVAKNKFTMYHGGAGATDAMDLYDNWFKPGGSLTASTTRLEDPAITAKINEAEQASPAQAKQIIQDLERWQDEELPMLVVGYQWPQVGISKIVHNYKPGADIDSRAWVAASVG